MFIDVFVARGISNKFHNFKVKILNFIFPNVFGDRRTYML